MFLTKETEEEQIEPCSKCSKLHLITELYVSDGCCIDCRRKEFVKQYGYDGYPVNKDDAGY
jgi:hypothetical protein